MGIMAFKKSFLEYLDDDSTLELEPIINLTKAKNLKAFEVVQGQTTAARKQEQMSSSHAEDPAVKELGKAQCKSPSIPNNQIGTNQVNWPEMVIA